jgi:hypothetical protein
MTTALFAAHPLPASDAFVQLRDLSLHELRTEWRRTFRRHPGPGLTRTLLIGMLAYQRQAAEHGDLSPKHQAFLDRVAERASKAREGQGRRPVVPPLPTNSMQPGTVLVREWAGQPQAVTVVEGGFLWNGATYATLSAVANAITGRHWNGWAFFGLKAPGAAGGPKPVQAVRSSAHANAKAVADTAALPRRRGRPPKARGIVAAGVSP